MSVLRVTNLLSNALTGSGAATPLNGSKNFRVDVRWGVGTSAGVVAVETAPYKDFAGTWKNIADFTWASANTADGRNDIGPFGAIRARITTTVVTSDKGVYVDLLEN